MRSSVLVASFSCVTDLTLGGGSVPPCNGVDMLAVGALASPWQWVTDGVEMKGHQTTPVQEPAAPDYAASQASSDKAHRNATRPWFNKKRFILPLCLVLFLAITVAVNATGDGGNFVSSLGGSQSKVESAPQAEAQAAGIGTKVRDGKFEFVVTGVERPGRILVGKLDETLTARGEFVVVRVTITNVGDEALSPDCSCQLLHNDEGREFEPSSSILRTTGALKFVREIEPGETVEDVLVLFDVAPGTKIVNIELHDSPFSPGVRVKLP